MAELSRADVLRRQVLALAVSAAFGASAYANPTGPSVVSGGATFATSGSTLTVTNTPGAIINWQQFSIQKDEVTRFIQQSAASSVLNRVTTQNPSQILGRLSSNGRVFLINPNGIAFGAGSMVDVAGLVASTLNISDGDWLAGRMRFAGTGTEGKLTHAGTIQTAQGGQVYLVAPNVETQVGSVISAPGGEVLIAAGKTVEFVNAATPDVRVEYSAPEHQAINAGSILAASGSVGIYGTLIRNSGTVNASRAEAGDGGRIVLKAAKDLTLEATSRIEASGATGGTITAQAQGGTLLAEGVIEARGDTAKGGEIKLLGTNVGLIGTATVDASGNAGGGTVLVGGDFQGKNPEIQNANQTLIAPEVAIRADAVQSGNGGTVVAWGDTTTQFYGMISARGGADWGNGGFVETSGHYLDFAGAVSSLAANGSAGTLLLDPHNLTVAATGTTIPTGFADPTNAGNVTLSAASLQTALQGGNVTLFANTDITFSNSVSVVAGTNNLVLRAGRSEIIGNNVSISVGGQFDATFNDAGATSANRDAGAAAFTMNAGSSISAPGGVAIRSGTLAANAGGATTVAANTGNMTLRTITSGGNVVLQGGNDITLQGPATVTGSGARFTAQAGRHVNVNGALTTNNGQINLEADSPHAPSNIPNKIGQLTITAPVSSNGGKITLIAGGNATGVTSTSNSITGPDGNVNNAADNAGFRPIAIVDAGAGGIDLSLSRSSDELGIGVTGTITQILGNGVTTPGFGSISNLRTTGLLRIGEATTAGTDGLGTGAQTLTVNRISNTYNNSYIALTPIVAGTFELRAGAGGILLDQPLTTYQPTIIATTGTLTISDPINTSGNNLTLPATVTITSNGSINTGGGSCSGAACPVTTIFWDGDAGPLDTSWFTATNWSTNTVPTLSDDVTIASGAGTVLIATGATAQAKSLIANRNVFVSAGSLQLSNASQFSGQFTLSGTGKLIGTGSAAVTGAGGSLVWSGGTMENGGSFLLAGGNSGTLSNTLTLNRLFENQGALTLGTGLVGATINGTGSVVNSGLLTAASGTSNTINALLANVITPTVGTIQLNGGGTTLTASSFPTNDGNIVVGNGATFSTGGAALANSATSSVLVSAGNYAAGATSVTTDVSGNIAVSGALSAGTVTLVSGGSGGVTLNAGSTVTATGSEVDSIVISGASFTNNSGSTVLSPGSGRWLVYLPDAAGNTFGPSGNVLSSGNLAIWGQAYAAAVSDAGNRYVFSNPGTVTVTTTNASKGYGDAPIDLSANYTVSGRPLQAATFGNVYLNATLGDIFSTGPDVASVGNSAAANVGGGAGTGGAYPITSTGTANSGYSLAFNNSGLLTINPATLTVLADAKTKVYGDADPALTYAASGFKLSDTSSVLSGGLTRVAGETVAGGPYAINQGTLAANGNYAIVYTGNNLTISPATLTYVANLASREYGDANSAFSGTVTGFKNSETQGTATTGTLAFASPATTTSNVGSYAINGGGLTANNGNYLFTQAPGNATALTINPAVISVSGNRFYDGSSNFPGGAFGSGGVVNGKNGETLSVTGSGTVGSASVAAGVQPLALGTLTLASGTGAASNYTLTGGTHTGTINPATLTYVADTASRNVGDPNPPFTGNVTGFVAGETLATATTGTLLFTSPATTASPEGQYPINGSGLAANNGNYMFVQAPSNAIALTVAAITNLGAAQSAYQTTVNAANNAPNTTLGMLTAQQDAARAGGQAFLQTQNGDTILLTAAPGTQGGVYVNLDTGQQTVITPNETPAPGIYYNEQTSTVVAVAKDDTGKTVVLTGTASSDTVAKGGRPRLVSSVGCK